MPVPHHRSPSLPCSHLALCPPCLASPLRASCAGLARLSLQAGSGSVVFEEADHAPLELELSHVARLLAEHSGGGGGGGGACWRVELGMRRDDVVRGLGSPRLELTRIAS